MDKKLQAQQSVSQPIIVHNFENGFEMYGAITKIQKNTFRNNLLADKKARELLIPFVNTNRPAITINNETKNNFSVNDILKLNVCGEHNNHCIYKALLSENDIVEKGYIQGYIKNGEYNIPSKFTTIKIQAQQGKYGLKLQNITLDFAGKDDFAKGFAYAQFNLLEGSKSSEDKNIQYKVSLANALADKMANTNFTLTINETNKTTAFADQNVETLRQNLVNVAKCTDAKKQKDITDLLASKKDIGTINQGLANVLDSLKPDTTKIKEALKPLVNKDKIYNTIITKLGAVVKDGNDFLPSAIDIEGLEKQEYLVGSEWGNRVFNVGDASFLFKTEHSQANNSYFDVDFPANKILDNANGVYEAFFPNGENKLKAFSGENATANNKKREDDLINMISGSGFQTSEKKITNNTSKPMLVDNPSIAKLQQAFHEAKFKELATSVATITDIYSKNADKMSDNVADLSGKLTKLTDAINVDKEAVINATDAESYTPASPEAFKALKEKMKEIEAKYQEEAKEKFKAAIIQLLPKGSITEEQINNLAAINISSKDLVKSSEDVKKILGTTNDNIINLVKSFQDVMANNIAFRDNKNRKVFDNFNKQCEGVGEKIQKQAEKSLGQQKQPDGMATNLPEQLFIDIFKLEEVTKAKPLTIQTGINNTSLSAQITQRSTKNVIAFGRKTPLQSGNNTPPNQQSKIVSSSSNSSIKGGNTIYQNPHNKSLILQDLQQCVSLNKGIYVFSKPSTSQVDIEANDPRVEKLLGHLNVRYATNATALGNNHIKIYDDEKTGAINIGGNNDNQVKLENIKYEDKRNINVNNGENAIIIPFLKDDATCGNAHIASALVAMDLLCKYKDKITKNYSKSDEGYKISKIIKMYATALENYQNEVLSFNGKGDALYGERTKYTTAKTLETEVKTLGIAGLNAKYGQNILQNLAKISKNFDANNKEGEGFVKSVKDQASPEDLYANLSKAAEMLSKHDNALLQRIAKHSLMPHKAKNDIEIKLQRAFEKFNAEGLFNGSEAKESKAKDTLLTLLNEQKQFDPASAGKLIEDVNAIRGNDYGAIAKEVYDNAIKVFSKFSANEQLRDETQFYKSNNVNTMPNNGDAGKGKSVAKALMTHLLGGKNIISINQSSTLEEIKKAMESIDKNSIVKIDEVDFLENKFATYTGEGKGDEKNIIQTLIETAQKKSAKVELISATLQPKHIAAAILQFINRSDTNTFSIEPTDDINNRAMNLEKKDAILKAVEKSLKDKDKDIVVKMIASYEKAIKSEIEIAKTVDDTTEKTTPYAVAASVKKIGDRELRIIINETPVAIANLQDNTHEYSNLKTLFINNPTLAAKGTTYIYLDQNKDNKVILKRDATGGITEVPLSQFVIHNADKLLVITTNPRLDTSSQLVATNGAIAANFDGQIDVNINAGGNSIQDDGRNRPLGKLNRKYSSDAYAQLANLAKIERQFSNGTAKLRDSGIKGDGVLLQATNTLNALSQEIKKAAKDSIEKQSLQYHRAKVLLRLGQIIKHNENNPSKQDGYEQFFNDKEKDMLDEIKKQITNTNPKENFVTHLKGGENWLCDEAEKIQSYFAKKEKEKLEEVEEKIEEQINEEINIGEEITGQNTIINEINEKIEVEEENNKQNLKEIGGEKLSDIFSQQDEDEQEQDNDDLFNNNNSSIDNQSQQDEDEDEDGNKQDSELLVEENKGQEQEQEEEKQEKKKPVEKKPSENNQQKPKTDTLVQNVVNLFEDGKYTKGDGTDYDPMFKERLVGVFHIALNDVRVEQDTKDAIKDNLKVIRLNLKTIIEGGKANSLGTLENWLRTFAMIDKTLNDNTLEKLDNEKLQSVLNDEKFYKFPNLIKAITKVFIEKQDHDNILSPQSLLEQFSAKQTQNPDLYNTLYNTILKQAVEEGILDNNKTLQTAMITSAQKQRGEDVNASAVAQGNNENTITSQFSSASSANGKKHTVSNVREANKVKKIITILETKDGRELKQEEKTLLGSMISSCGNSTTEYNPQLLLSALEEQTQQFKDYFPKNKTIQQSTIQQDRLNQSQINNQQEDTQKNI